MHNIDPAILEEAARQERIFNTVMYTGLALLCLFVLVVAIKQIGSFAKENGWKYTFQVAYLIAGGLAILNICVLALKKMHAYVTALVLIATDGASADFCHGVANIAVAVVCVLVLIWLHMVYKMISN